MTAIAQPGVAEFYSSEADAYRRLWAPELLPLSRVLLPGLPLGTAERVLEVGAGIGALMEDIAREAPSADVHGVDLAEGMIRLAPKDRPRAVADARNLPFRDGTFDVAIAAFILFHIPEPTDGVADMARVLRDGGTVGTVTWGDDTGYPALDIWTEELDRSGAEPATALARHDLVDTQDKVRALLDANGFEGIRTWSGRYVRPMTPDEFFTMRTSLGSSRYRFMSLPDDVREECLSRAKRRIESLSTSDLTDNAEVIYAIASKA
ncbi:MAG: class I SAM-dependent methyltransferase [Actinomycetota bacterium]